MYSIQMTDDYVFWSYGKHAFEKLHLVQVAVFMNHLQTSVQRKMLKE